MGDGGDADAIAELPVDFGSEVVLDVAGDPGKDAALPIVAGAGIGGGPIARERSDDEVIELTWAEPDTTSGP